MPTIDNRIIEALRRQQVVTEYIVYPQQMSEVENYQILLTNVPSYSKEDVLVVHNGKIIPHWVESLGKVWCKVPKLFTCTPLIVYVLTGNPAAVSASDGTNTFMFFDDFSGDLSKWDTWSFNGAGNIVISSGAMVITPSTTAGSGAGASSKLTPVTNNFIVEYTRKDLTIGNAIAYRGFTFGIGNMVGYVGALYIGAMYNGYNTWVHAYNNIGPYFEWTNGVASGAMTMDSFIPSDSNYHDYKVIYKDDGTATFYCDGVLIAHALDTSFLSDSKKIGFFNGLYNASTLNSVGYIDLVKSRKYVSPEPTIKKVRTLNKSLIIKELGMK